MKVKKDNSGAIQSADFVGLAQKCHVFRELFDFTAESDCERRLQQSVKNATGNFDETEIDSISKMITAPNIDWDTFCIPPYKFLHINLPLSSRDIRSTLKVFLLKRLSITIKLFRHLKRMIT